MRVRACEAESNGTAWLRQVSRAVNVGYGGNDQPLVVSSDPLSSDFHCLSPSLFSRVSLSPWTLDDDMIS